VASIGNALLRAAAHGEILLAQDAHRARKQTARWRAL